MHDLRIVHGDLKGVCILSDHISMHISLTREGEHPHQREPASVHRRLWSYNYHWRCGPCGCRGISGVVDIKRHTDAIY